MGYDLTNISQVSNESNFITKNRNNARRMHKRSIYGSRVSSLTLLEKSKIRRLLDEKNKEDLNPSKLDDRIFEYETWIDQDCVKKLEELAKKNEIFCWIDENLHSVANNKSTHVLQKKLKAINKKLVGESFNTENASENSIILEFENSFDNGQENLFDLEKIISDSFKASMKILEINNFNFST